MLQTNENDQNRNPEITENTFRASKLKSQIQTSVKQSATPSNSQKHNINTQKDNQKHKKESISESSGEEEDLSRDDDDLQQENEQSDPNTHKRDFKLHEKKDLKTIFELETDEEVERRKLDATKPLNLDKRSKVKKQNQKMLIYPFHAVQLI